MSIRNSIPLLVAVALAFDVSPGVGQGRPDPATLLASQREAIKPLAFMDGVWRGPAWTILPTGEKHEVTQTERIGPFLDGAVKVIEGRGYDDTGKVAFNAFAIVSFDPARRAYTMHSYAMGMVGDFALTPSDSGFVWVIPAGPATIRYTAVIRDRKWREIGERLVEGQAPIQFFEMNLVRLRDTDWPAAGAISAK